MNRRATFTQAELIRAIRAAQACGKVALLTPAGIVFAESDQITLPSAETVRENSCDSAFGTAP